MESWNLRRQITRQRGFYLFFADFFVGPFLAIAFFAGGFLAEIFFAPGFFLTAVLFFAGSTFFVGFAEEDCLAALPTGA